MATRTAPLVPMGDDWPTGHVAVQRHWPTARGLSSLALRVESFLSSAGFDRAPWLAVALAAGIAAWFAMPGPAAWIGGATTCLVLAAASAILLRDDDFGHLRRAAIAMLLMIAFGVGLIWARSAMIGAEPIAAPQVTWIDGRVLTREDQPAEGRVRLVLAYRDGESGDARKVRVNVAPEAVPAGVTEGARVRLRARLMPPAPPMVPGAYDFARTAWFAGLAATGSAIGPVRLIDSGDREGGLATLKRTLSAHVRVHLGGSAGAIAAAFASGDRGGIATADEEAMRDAGLTHLLSISGLHVSAVVAGAYVLAISLLALWPWLALRIRLPIAGATIAALVGVGYTLLTGAEVPTVRSCIGSLLVLGALALGREALSMRMVAAGAFVVMLLWPEAIVGPSFQMSFAAVIAIVALHEATPVRAFLGPREEPMLARAGRHGVMLLVTGLMIEFALMPIVLFHFHRAGFYGALANVVAIPLVTFISMPLIALALASDLIGLGAPVWWLAGKSLDLMLWIARVTAAQPGAVKLMPQMGWGTFALFVGGGIWLALWHGRRRLIGLVPVTMATASLVLTPAPDILVSSDGHHVGIVGEGDRLFVLREGRSDFARDNLLEIAGIQGEPLPIERWPSARCSADYCVVTLVRDGRAWSVLMARSKARVEWRALVAACERADIVIADRRMPQGCRPRWLKADRAMLSTSGGLAVYLPRQRVDTVANWQGRHPWWLANLEAQPKPRPHPNFAKQVTPPVRQNQ